MGKTFHVIFFMLTQLGWKVPYDSELISDQLTEPAQLDRLM